MMQIPCPRLLWAALVAAFFVPGPAAAQSRCADRETVVGYLAGDHHERPIAGGVTLQGGLVELFATTDGATWTIVVTMPRGPSCIVSAGEGWRWHGPKEEGPER